MLNFSFQDPVLKIRGTVVGPLEQWHTGYGSRMATTGLTGGAQCRTAYARKYDTACPDISKVCITSSSWPRSWGGTQDK